MSYKTYTTEAIVCGSRVNNTSDKAFLLFTREGGILWASARSVREERSKQRFALQDFSLVRISLVRGKSGWRIGSVESSVNFFTEAKSQAARANITSVVKLLRQFLHGEVSHTDIFDDTKAILGQSLTASAADLAKIKTIYFLRLLYQLGYIASRDVYEGYLTETNWWTLPPLPPEAEKAMEIGENASHL